MKYLILLVFLVPAVMGQGLLEVIEGTECENMFSALRDAMESSRPDFYGPQDFFSSIGLSLENKKQLKRFACKLPDVTTINGLAKISPVNEYSEVAKKYLEMISRLNAKAGGVQKVIKTFKLYVTINEKGRFLPVDITTLPWNVDENEALILFSRLVRDFGSDFPTFLMKQASSFNGEFFNMTDVSQFVDALYKYDSIDKAARELQVKPRLLEAFLRIFYFASNTEVSTIQLYKRTYILAERLDDIEFFNLSIL